MERMMCRFTRDQCPKTPERSIGGDVPRIINRKIAVSFERSAEVYLLDRPAYWTAQSVDHVNQ